jgi:HlyD family secretion protein
MKKVVFALVLLGLGIAIGVVGYRRALADRRAAGAGELRLFGNVDIRDAQLAFRDPERIDRVLVEEGARVAAGELLATQRTERLLARISGAEAGIAAQQAVVERLERGSRPEEIEQARAQKDAADARVANAELAIQRLEVTARSGATSAQALDDARAALAVERATARVQAEALALALAGPRAEDVAQARAALSGLDSALQELRQGLADSELFAPAPGVIQSRLLEPGEMASAERPVFTLALTDPKWVRAWVPEPSLARVANGMRATIYADAFGGTTYPGWVGFVSPVAEFTPKSVETEELRTKLVFEVRVFVQDPNDELRLGMPVTVDVDSAGGTDHAPPAKGDE